MKVEIWSDIMCPFCYIGKRHYEAAVKQFPQAEELKLEWHSYQLDPTIPKQMDEDLNVYQYLAQRKGVTEQEARKMHDGVMAMANAAGLDYNFDIAVVANSFDAHRMIQMAKSKGLGDEAEERLFRAYFAEGKNFADHEVLMELGKEIGLTEKDIQESLTNDEYAYKVNQDIQEAAAIGVRGVPFFVFNRKYGVSGAQPVSVFLETIEKSFKEWKNEAL